FSQNSYSSVSQRRPSLVATVPGILVCNFYDTTQSTNPRHRDRCKRCKRNRRCIQKTSLLSKNSIAATVQTHRLERNVCCSPCLPPLARVLAGRACSPGL